ncbi:carbonic anhydrase [Roseovarius sp. SCSIO 43702]|uniref:carbonic anhydrase n=1 Tax=Roseovarius sp. SCSIO 43702 TaxID=2823043 RepID=UPI001C7346C1|nr:carbonic anhydrase [Roseovarius sp. SCSIO 43702]QYX56192.1 carbonic anhydrase [Roseovarius sp. SCSIO 43702]
MKNARPLPSYLVQRYHGWKATSYAENQSWYRRLAEEGQHPRAMIISCCDSRVQVTSIFGADQGEFFIHRNIANLVPPYETGGSRHGTSATIEYAVTALKVAHVIVMGHSNCGGVQGCLDMCEGSAPALEKKSSFVGRWMDILRPSYEKVKDIPDPNDRAQALEHEAVLISLKNLMTFPFVASEVEAGRLSLHGVWLDIGPGGVLHYIPEHDKFVAV